MDYLLTLIELAHAFLFFTMTGISLLLGYLSGIAYSKKRQDLMGVCLGLWVLLQIVFFLNFMRG